MPEQQQLKIWRKLVNRITPGMVVVATKGDLGEEDVSKSKVVRVVRNTRGDVEKILVDKGVVFKKELEIPADRIKDVKLDAGEKGIIVVDVVEKEVEALENFGQEQLPPEKEALRKREQDQDNTLLEDVEEAIPTAEGLRELEMDSVQEDQEDEVSQQQQSRGIWGWFRQFGPGFLGGMAGNDSSAVAAYAVDGARNGFGHLWLLLLATPLYQATMFACAHLGRVTQKGLAEVLREHYGRPVSLLAALILVVANIALITADLVAIGSGLELITGISWVWFVIPVGVLLWYLTVFQNFESIKRIFIVMSLAFVTYFVTAFLTHPDLGTVLYNTFVPHIDLNFASVSSAVALLGATISPYNIFWQVQGEKEEKRPGTLKQKLRFASVDIGVGVVSGNLIAYFIILSTATTLFVHHKTVATAADAATSLAIIGPAAKYLFAIGLIGAGLVAIPVLLASTSYAVAGSFGWPTGLSKKPWQNEGFYLILTIAALLSLTIALLRFDPITLLFWANVLSGILAPILVVYLLLVGYNRKIMKEERLGILTTIGLVLTFIVMATAAVLLLYGLATGQGGS